MNQNNKEDQKQLLGIKQYSAPEVMVPCHQVFHKDSLYSFQIGPSTNEILIHNFETGNVQKFQSPDRGNEDMAQQSIMISKKMEIVVVGDFIYFCGGKAGKEQKGFELIGFNCRKRQWQQFPGIDVGGLEQEVQQKMVDDGQSKLIFTNFKNLYLVLMRINRNTESTFIWIFDINQQFWEQCNVLSLPKMHNISTCLMNKKLFLLGKDEKNISKLLKFQMELQEEAEGIPILFKYSEVVIPESSDITENPPQILPISANQFILLIEKNQKLLLQIFDTVSQKWGRINCNFLQSLKNNLIIHFSYTNDALMILSNNKIYRINKKPLFNELINELRYESPQTCEICYQTRKNKNQLMEPFFKITSKMVEELTQNMDFPFSAIGLLADNCFNYSASMMNIQYNQFNGRPYLKIEDDSKIMMSNQQLQQILVNFQAMRCFNFSSVQRRIRSVITKQSLRKQFGTNMKLASLRIGQQMLYISINSLLDVRVAYFTMQQDEYVCYYYVQDMKTKRLHEDYSLEIRSLVENRFGDLILTSLHSDESTKLPAHKNTLFIFGLKQVENQHGNLVSELVPHQNTLSEDPDSQGIHHIDSDILYISPNQETYKKHLQFGCRINQSVDVSLVAYLTALFLKNDHLKIYLQIYEGPRRYINYLDRYANVDKYLWQKYVCPINETLNKFQFKQHFELYVNNNLGKKLRIFHNGVLLYHKNRLVTRFGECQLGQLLHYMALKPQLSQGYFNIFGTIELPDSLQVNQVKTDFLYPLMLEKFRSRINFIHEWATLSFDFKETSSNHNLPIKEGPKLRPRAVELEGPHSNPVKRSKRHNPDYQGEF